MADATEILTLADGKRSSAISLFFDYNKIAMALMLICRHFFISLVINQSEKLLLRFSHLCIGLEVLIKGDDSSE